MEAMSEGTEAGWGGMIGGVDELKFDVAPDKTRAAGQQLSRVWAQRLLIISNHRELQRAFSLLWVMSVHVPALETKTEMFWTINFDIAVRNRLRIEANSVFYLKDHLPKQKKICEKRDIVLHFCTFFKIPDGQGGQPGALICRVPFGELPHVTEPLETCSVSWRWSESKTAIDISESLKIGLCKPLARSWVPPASGLQGHIWSRHQATSLRLIMGVTTQEMCNFHWKDLGMFSDLLCLWSTVELALNPRLSGVPFGAPWPVPSGVGHFCLVCLVLRFQPWAGLQSYWGWTQHSSRTLWRRRPCSSGGKRSSRLSLFSRYVRFAIKSCFKTLLGF